MEKKSYETLLLEDPEHAIHELYQRFNSLGREGSRNTDEIFTNYCKGMASALRDENNAKSIDPEQSLGHYLIRSVEIRRELGQHSITPRGLIELNFRSLQQLLVKNYQIPLGFPEYPHQKYMTDRAIWPNIMRRFFIDEEIDPSAIILHERTMEMKEVQSNVAQRAATSAALMGIFRPWFGEHPAFLDGGTASLAIPQKLLMPELPFRRIQITGAESSMSRKTNAALEIKNLIQTRSPLRYALGVDAVPFDVDDMDWNMACTIRGNEWYDQELLDEYEKMKAGYEPLRYMDMLEFAQVDLTDPGAEEQIKTILDESRYVNKAEVEVGNVSFMLYLLKNKQLQKKAIAAMRAVSQLLIVSDFCDRDPDDPTDLTIDDQKRGDFSYKTYVNLPGDDSGIFYHFISAQNGRNTRWRLGEDFQFITEWASNPR